MQAGKLDRRLTFRPVTITTDAMNQAVESFGDTVTVWAEKMDLSDSERVKAQQVGAEMTTRFRVRYSAAAAALTPQSRVACEGKEYELTNVKEISRREGIELTATVRL